MKPTTEPARKPHFALLLATGFGLGDLPLAPGTWGSLLGLSLAWLFARWRTQGPLDVYVHDRHLVVSAVHAELAVAVIIAFLGVWTAARAAKYFGEPDPRKVVIDEVSGQHLTLLIAALLWNPAANWKYFLVGFILFRVFDIWKPFPARQAEALPGGWGIMADDWIAGVYAAVGLWVAGLLGL